MLDDIFNGYKGKITNNDEIIRIENKNRLISRYESGEIYQDKMVVCSVYVDKKNMSVGADESTYEILGGCHHPHCDNIDELKTEVKRLLERYNFPKQDYKQELLDL